MVVDTVDPWSDTSNSALQGSLLLVKAGVYLAPMGDTGCRCTSNKFLPWCGYQYMIATGNGSYGSTRKR
ncbi:hypothetical protein FOXB_10595 [Fusarium oxysporum f. sp. conglutinans Fo5176]|uniref:Uncharacterized protein n=1 Tax=Fusarium oxysporum (strain Fo5176) TaxID=660025 RepID=F9FW14_FUSOF|nr:hypothetical protein FOXB_10595 [Fusarium oxysporum f. sp. conglutinans Fo5176]